MIEFTKDLHRSIFGDSVDSLFLSVKFPKIRDSQVTMSIPKLAQSWMIRGDLHDLGNLHVLLVVLIHTSSVAVFSLSAVGWLQRPHTTHDETKN